MNVHCSEHSTYTAGCAACATLMEACAAASATVTAITCACGAHKLPLRAAGNSPGVLVTRGANGVQHTRRACQRYQPTR